MTSRIQSQKGFSLLMLLLIMVALAGLVSFATKSRQRQMIKIDAYRISDGLSRICASADVWASRNWNNLNPGQVRQLTSADLAGIPPLSPQVLSSLYGVSWQVQISKKGTAGSYVGDVQVISNGFRYPDGKPNLQLASMVASRIGNNAAVDADGTGFVGLSGNSRISNPTNQAGAVLFRCGDANTSTAEISLRGSRGLTSNWNVGGQSIQGLPIQDSGVTQINQQAANGTHCTTLGEVRLDALQHLYHCGPGNVWIPSAKTVSQTLQQDVYETISLPGDGG